MDSSDDSKPNFFKYVFKFDDDGKSELLNIIQYALLAIVPIVILNKTMQKIVPEADEEKGNVEILAEIVIQVVCTFVGLLIVDRIVTYVPTYSGVKYPNISVIQNILVSLMIMTSLQTKLGNKVSIIVERISEMWNGSSEDSNGKKGKNGNGKNGNGKNGNGKNGNVKVSQPISGNGQILPQTSQGQYNDGTSIHSLPVNDYQQPSQNYTNASQQQGQNQYQNQSQNQGQGQQEVYPDSGGVVPASEFGGFGGFSSW